MEKYIKLEDIKEIMKLYSKWPLSMENHIGMFEKINSIDTINSPIEVIDYMINKAKIKRWTWCWYMMEALEEAKDRITK